MTMTMHVSDLPLFARPDEPVFVTAPSTPLETRYARWYRKNPHVFDALERAALKRFREGATHLSVAKLFEDLREDPTITTKGDGYKLNNSFRAPLARHIIFKNLQLDGLFELRALRNHLSVVRAGA